MDPRLFDIVWEVYREVGSRSRSTSLRPTARPAPTRCCAAARARSPSTASTCSARRWISICPTYRWTDSRDRHAAAARRRRLVPERRQSLRPPRHRQRTRVAAHDPRPTGRLFPTGKTVHIPADGQPLPALRGGEGGVWPAAARWRATPLTPARRRANTRAAGAACGPHCSAATTRTPNTTVPRHRDAGPPPSRPTRLPTARMAARAGFLLSSGRRSRRNNPKRRRRSPQQAGLTALKRRARHPRLRLCLRAGQAIWRFSRMRRCRPPARSRSRALASFRFQVRFWIRTATDQSLPSRRPASRCIPLPWPAAYFRQPPPRRPIPCSERPRFLRAGRSRMRTTRRRYALCSRPRPPRLARPRAQGSDEPTKPQPVAAGELLAHMGPTLNLRLASNPTNDLSASRFTGPAVKPLPVLR